MTLVLILLVFNAGFLLGTWWGSGWRRRERNHLGDEVRRLRREVDELSSRKHAGSLLYFDPPTKKQTG